MERNEYGWAAPVLRCDACMKPITDSGMAVVTFGGEWVSVPMHAHKGTCHDTLDGRAVRKLPWQELSHFLVWLCQSAGIGDGARLSLFHPARACGIHAPRLAVSVQSQPGWLAVSGQRQSH